MGDDALSFVRSLLDTAHSEPMPVLIVATVREEALARAHRAGQLLDDLLLRPDVQDRCGAAARR